MAAGGHFEKKSKQKKAAYWFEMVRNAIESDFWRSKMVADGRFVYTI